MKLLGLRGKLHADPDWQHNGRYLAWNCTQVIRFRLGSISRSITGRRLVVAQR